MTIQVGNNLLDPLLKSPEQQRALLDKMRGVAHGFAMDDVIGAAVNMLVAAVRQSHPTRMQAEARFDELAGRTKTLLLSHYDSVTGKRLSIFPFTQHVQAQHLQADDVTRKN